MRKARKDTKLYQLLGTEVDLQPYPELLEHMHYKAIYNGLINSIKDAGEIFCKDLALISPIKYPQNYIEWPGYSECKEHTLKQYLNSAGLLGEIYKMCKSECVVKEPELADALNIPHDKRMFNIHQSNPCLRECTSEFVGLLQKITNYYTNGMYIFIHI